MAADGKTAYEKLKGKSYRRELGDYGEKVMFMPIVHGGRVKKLETEMSFGRFCGIRPRSNEMLIMTTDGIKKARSAETSGARPLDPGRMGRSSRTSLELETGETQDARFQPDTRIGCTTSGTHVRRKGCSETKTSVHHSSGRGEVRLHTRMPGM